MSTKKQTKIVEPKPRYAIDQIVFSIVYHKGKPEQLNEGSIFSVKSRKIADLNYLGKKIGTRTAFTYEVNLPNGGREELFETAIYPSFFEAAKVFAKAFLFTLK